MRSGYWTYLVRTDADGYVYATLHFRGRETAYSEDRFVSTVSAIDWCHQHADQGRGWTNTQRLTEIRRIDPAWAAEIVNRAAVAQGFARQKHNRVVYRRNCNASMVNLEGEGVRFV